MAFQMSQMGELAGFMRLGPQVYPERTNAVQIIERGPHGQRLAADPVKVREHERGSGFRFWVEELNVPANESWNPRQRVTGLLGLGDLPSNWACPVRSRRELADRIDRLESAIDIAETASSLEAVRAEKETLLECHMRMGEGRKFASHRDRILGVGNLILLKKGSVSRDAVDPRTGAPRLDPNTTVASNLPWALRERIDEIVRGKGDGLCSEEQLRVPLVGSFLCKGKGDPRGFVSNPLATAVLVVVGGYVLYAVASGFGRGMAGK